jgi:1,4-dihydroxy-2-naphthoate octaprenyltransferase
MATTALWIAGARVRTLPAAVAPVLVGTGAAVGLGAAHGGRAALAAGVALALQVGVNYANDYSDGVKGTDRHRVGPLRLTGSGLVAPSAVRRAAAASFALAALLGLALCALAGTWWLVAVGAAAVLAAWFYTGGRNPYGYRGLGEVAVFTFFGLVAVLGTTYTQAGTTSLGAVAGAVGIGSLACALLMANNIRDIPTDQGAGKRTLAVRLGERRARVAYAAFVTVPFLLALALVTRHPWAAATLVLAVPAALLARRVLRGARGRDLILVLRDTGLVELGYGVALGTALAL